MEWPEKRPDLVWTMAAGGDGCASDGCGMRRHLWTERREMPAARVSAGGGEVAGLEGTSRLGFERGRRDRRK